MHTTMRSLPASSLAASCFGTLKRYSEADRAPTEALYDELRQDGIPGEEAFETAVRHDLKTTWGRMHEGRIAPVSAVIFYPAVKCTKSVCMSRG